MRANCNEPPPIWFDSASDHNIWAGNWWRRWSEANVLFLLRLDFALRFGLSTLRRILNRALLRLAFSSPLSLKFGPGKQAKAR
jgi:hypothetical protein